MNYDNILVDNNNNIVVLSMEKNYYKMVYEEREGFLKIFKYIPLESFFSFKEKKFKIIEHSLVKVDECIKIIDDFYSAKDYILNGYNSFFISWPVYYIKNIEKATKIEYNEDELYY